MATMETPCTWPVDTTCLPTVPEEQKPRLREAIDTAVGVLWALTGRRFGVCPVTVRPCPPGTDTASPSYVTGPGWAPYLEDGVWRNTSTCTISCDRSGAILLPGPVHEILSMLVGDTPLGEGSIIQDGDRVYRAHGGAWPTQNLTVPLGHEGSWCIRYLRGTPPPPGAAHAVGVLATEFYNACNGGRCRLPRRTQQVQRQGVTVTMIDPEDIYAQGAVGIPEVDLWVRAHNPHRLSEPTLLWSPDMGVW